MNFTKSELEMLYQYAAPTKEETLAGLKEIVPVLERTVSYTHLTLPTILLV